METRARYILMGLFVLLMTVGGFGFVYWLHNTSSVGEKAVYRVIFQGSVSEHVATHAKSTVIVTR